MTIPTGLPDTITIVIPEWLVGSYPMGMVIWPFVEFVGAFFLGKPKVRSAVVGLLYALVWPARAGLFSVLMFCWAVGKIMKSRQYNCTTCKDRRIIHLSDGVSARKCPECTR